MIVRRVGETFELASPIAGNSAAASAIVPIARRTRTG
jgi:hypothetical protein